MVAIVAYAWCADICCPECTKAAYNVNVLKPDAHSPNYGHFDEHNLPDMIDREGNRVHPVFSTDEYIPAYCGSCHEELS